MLQNFHSLRKVSSKNSKMATLFFYASKVKNTEKSGQQEMEEIFIYTLYSNEPVITLAKQAQKYTDGITNSVYLRLKDGTRYHGFPGDSNKKILNFDLYDLKIIDGGVKKPKDTAVKIESKDTTTLFDSSELKEISELQWRLSQPLSVLILSIFGILLGKASPRGGKNLGVLLGVVVFILYNNALLVAKSSLEQGTTVSYCWALVGAFINDLNYFYLLFL